MIGHFQTLYSLILPLHALVLSQELKALRRAHAADGLDEEPPPR